MKQVLYSRKALNAHHNDHEVSEHQRVGWARLKAHNHFGQSLLNKGDELEQAEHYVLVG